MAKGRARSGAASARRLAAGSITFALLLLAAAPALADGAFWSEGRFAPLDARLSATEPEPSVDPLRVSSSLSRPTLRKAALARSSPVPRDAAIELRVRGPLAEESAAGLALEIRF
jgi:hypothetical protein